MSIKSFSFYAFIFSSLFYFKNDMNLKFFLYLLLPLIFMVPLVYVTRNFPDAFICGLFLAHTLAGFRGNIDLYKHKVRFLKKYEHLITEQSDEEKKEKEIVYFCISPLRLVVCSLLTCGLYEIYWACKNWRAIADATGKNINPILRGWFFGVFFIYPLFKNMAKSISRFKPVSKMFKISVFLYLLYIIALCMVLITANKIEDLDFQNIKMFNGAFMYYFLSFISPFFLVYIQKEINFYNGSLPEKVQPKTKLSGEEIFIVVFCFFINYGILLIPAQDVIN